MIRQLKDSLKRISLLKHIVTKFKQNVLGNIDDNSFKYHEYPWNIELEKRLEKLVAAKKKNLKTVVYIHNKPDPLTFRYRAYNMSQVLDKTYKFSGHYFFEYELSELVKHTEFIDTAIFIRIGWSPDAISLLDQLQTENKQVGYETDDYVFDTDTIPDLIEQLAVPEESHGFYFYYVSRLHNLAKYADFYTTTNDFLAKKIKGHYKKPVYVLRNYLNDEQTKKSIEINKTLNLEKKISAARDKFVIGYFSGTKTHDRDFGMIAEALAKILSEYQQVELLIVGHLKIPQVLKNYSSRIKRNGLVDYLTLMERIASVNLNIAPLKLNDFTNCKSELKYFDAGIVYVPSVVSPTFCFKQAVKDGENGLIAEEDKWYEKIKKAIDDESLYKEMAVKAHGHSLEEYYGEKINTEVTNTLSKLI